MTGTVPRRRGRPAGASDARQRILSAAREGFARHGYAATTLRALAARAGVDPALIAHYFGSKSQLFQAAVRAPLNPRRETAALRGVPPNRLGGELLRTVLGVWESPAGGRIAQIVGAALRDASTQSLIREFFLTQGLLPVVRSVEPDARRAEARAMACFPVIFGVLCARYLFHVEPLASAPAEAVVELYGPTLQRLLTGPVPALGSADGGPVTPRDGDGAGRRGERARRPRAGSGPRP